MKNNFFTLLDTADRIKHYDDSYSRYHGLKSDDIKGYNPDKPLEEVGTDVRHVLVILGIFFLIFLVINK